MKTILMSAALIAGSVLSQASFAENYVINPLNVNNVCLAYGVTTVRDHRVTPTKISYLYPATTKECPTTPAYRLSITTASGRIYNGVDGYYVIRNQALNRCLTNPATYTGNFDNGKLMWQRCANQGAGGAAATRQLFMVKKNQYGSTRFENHLMIFLNVPNSRSECMERNGTSVVRQNCQLNNWQIRRVN